MAYPDRALYVLPVYPDLHILSLHLRVSGKVYAFYVFYVGIVYQ